MSIFIQVLYAVGRHFNLALSCMPLSRNNRAMDKRSSTFLPPVPDEDKEAKPQILKKVNLIVCIIIQVYPTLLHICDISVLKI